MATKKEREKKVVTMLGDHKTAMLVTHGVEGGLVSRPMTTQKPEFDGDVWFFVSSDADVIKEIEANPEVNISYSKNKSYLSVAGTGEIVTDVEKKKELWYPELKKWFNGKGPEDDYVMLIKVSADTARYWDMDQDKSEKKKDGNPIDEGMVEY